MDDLYDAIETATLENEFHCGLRPVIPWKTPTEEEMDSWLVEKNSKAAEDEPSAVTGGKYGILHDLSWLVSQEIGLYLFAQFVKETAQDYLRMNFLEEVYRFRNSFSSQTLKLLASLSQHDNTKPINRQGLRKAKQIVKLFLLPAPTDPQTGEKIHPSPTVIDETDLKRTVKNDGNGNNKLITKEQVAVALEQHFDFPTCSESAIGLQGRCRLDAIKQVQAWEDAYRKRRNAVLHTSLSVRGAGKDGQLNKLKLSMLDDDNHGFPGEDEEPPRRQSSRPPVNEYAVPSIAALESVTLFDEAEAIVFASVERDYAKGFFDSSYYRKLLNFLWFQDRRVVQEDFFTMRVLGRGGFGLVKGEFQNLLGGWLAGICVPIIYAHMLFPSFQPAKKELLVNFML